MVTKKAIAELAEWAQAANAGDRQKANDHLQQQFRHLGASLIASKEFQSHFREQHSCRIDPADLECFCRFLGAIADLEADQTQPNG